MRSPVLESSALPLPFLAAPQCFGPDSIQDEPLKLNRKVGRVCLRLALIVGAGKLFAKLQCQVIVSVPRDTKIVEDSPKEIPVIKIDDNVVEAKEKSAATGTIL